MPAVATPPPGGHVVLAVDGPPVVLVVDGPPVVLAVDVLPTAFPVRAGPTPWVVPVEQSAGLPGGFCTSESVRYIPLLWIKRHSSFPV